MKEYGAVLSALVDGQVVDPAALRAALEQPEAIELLVDFAVLRGRLAGEPPVPLPRFYDSWHAELRLASRHALPMRLFAAAAALTMAVAGGFWAGSALGPSGQLPIVPPVPTITTRLENPTPAPRCGDLQAATVGTRPSRVTSVQPSSPPSANDIPPRPTRVFYLSNDLARSSGGEEEN